jgi:hypothetical protein
MGLYTLIRKEAEDFLALNLLLLRVAVAICHCLIHRPSYTNARATNLKHKSLIDVFKIYVSESKIIRTIGTCFAVGYTAGWA